MTRREYRERQESRIITALLYAALVGLVWAMALTVVDMLDSPHTPLSVEELEKRRRILESYGYIVNER